MNGEMSEKSTLPSKRLFFKFSECDFAGVRLGAEELSQDRLSRTRRVPC